MASQTTSAHWRLSGNTYLLRDVRLNGSSAFPSGPNKRLVIGSGLIASSFRRTSNIPQFRTVPHRLTTACGLLTGVGLGVRTKRIRDVTCDAVYREIACNRAVSSRNEEPRDLLRCGQDY
ncbi:hypothetical protein PUN28_001495 [Cardiocondyla obscurior]|uniref:Uncharacterized protein n=1 Tax=Cardiocondyla obscurior TaxID=286306 RepID=A0AAW2H5C7_9HYME